MGSGYLPGKVLLFCLKGHLKTSEELLGNLYRGPGFTLCFNSSMQLPCRVLLPLPLVIPALMSWGSSQVYSHPHRSCQGRAGRRGSAVGKQPGRQGSGVSKG